LALYGNSLHKRTQRFLYLLFVIRTRLLMAPSLLLHPIQLFKRFASSIAYLPTLAALAYGTLALLAFIAPVSSDVLPESIRQLGLSKPGAAQPLLLALLGGMISLMVFSFSMVMSVLSQAG